MSNNTPKPAKTRIVYKVLSYYPVDGEPLSSAWNWQPVGYAVGQTTFPRVGKLFAFDNLEDARDAYKSLQVRCTPEGFDTGCIYEAEATGVSKISFMALYKSDIEKFWKQRAHRKIRVKRRPMPKGSVSCASIKLLKFVEKF